MSEAKRVVIRLGGPVAAALLVFYGVLAARMPLTWHGRWWSAAAAVVASALLGTSILCDADARRGARLWVICSLAALCGCLAWIGISGIRFAAMFEQLRLDDPPAEVQLMLALAALVRWTFWAIAIAFVAFSREVERGRFSYYLQPLCIASLLAILFLIGAVQLGLELPYARVLEHRTR